jgi:DNA-directed RNA polymerase subunit RPC12/RpoP
MKSVIELKCPRCGADLSVENDREILYCEYCGAKIVLTDENTFTINKTIRKIDDAEIARAETERIVQMHKIEMEKEQEKKKRKQIKYKIVIACLLDVIGIVMICLNRHSFFTGLSMIFISAVIWKEIVFD